MKPTACIICGTIALNSDYCFKCNRDLVAEKLVRAKEDAAIGIFQVLFPGAFPCLENTNELIKHLEVFIQAELATRGI